MFNRFVLFLLASVVLFAAACVKQENSIHPALRVESTPSGYYDILAPSATVTTTCPNSGIISGRTPPESLEIIPRADRPVGTYYARLNAWDYPGAANHPEVIFGVASSAGRFQGLPAVSLLGWGFDRDVFATVSGQRFGDRLEIRYVDNVPPGKDQSPGCQVVWQMTAVRRALPAYEAVLIPLKQDCYDKNPVHEGAIIQVTSEGNAFTLQFDFAGGAQETFSPVIPDSGGRFKYQSPPSLTQTLGLEGEMDEDGLITRVILSMNLDAGEVGVHCSDVREVQLRPIH